MGKLLSRGKLPIFNVGIDSFVDSIRAAGAKAHHLEWQPPGSADPKLAWMLARMMGDPDDPDAIGSRIDRANEAAVQRVIGAQPMLVDVALHARDVWPDMGRMLTHAGAPIAWDDMCGPMQGAAVGAVLYEGWAETPEEARRMLAAGEIPFSPCHPLNAVAPMVGIISSSMPLLVVRDASHGNVAYCNLNEGIGRVLRFGANGPDVIERLKWIETVLAPGIRAALQCIEGGVPLKSIQSQALLMGDEVHSRNTAATLMFLNAIAAPLIESGFPHPQVCEILRFIGSNSQFFLNLSMVASKAIMDAGHGVEGSSMVTAISRNGVTVAIRVSGLGNGWFEGGAEPPVGLFFPGFSQEDANPDLGDSAICETAGYGGLSLAASPALVQLVGGTPDRAVQYSKEMYEITLARNPGLSLPALDFAGAPTGIDVRKVLDTGIRPVLTTGIAHKVAGIGQVGAGIVRVPMDCFSSALAALAERLGVEDLDAGATL